MSIYHRVGHTKCGMPEMVYVPLKTESTRENQIAEQSPAMVLCELKRVQFDLGVP